MRGAWAVGPDGEAATLGEADALDGLDVLPGFAYPLAACSPSFLATNPQLAGCWARVGPGRHRDTTLYRIAWNRWKLMAHPRRDDPRPSGRGVPQRTAPEPYSAPPIDSPARI